MPDLSGPLYAHEQVARLRRERLEREATLRARLMPREARVRRAWLRLPGVTGGRLELGRLRPAALRR